jgi:trk system potassium uptake protein TrkA
MHVIIVGAGEVGFNIAKKLTAEGKDVVLIDDNQESLDEVSSTLDVQTIHGNGSSPGVLKKANIDKANMLIAVTNNDDTNMIACLVAKTQVKPPIKIARISNPEFVNSSKVTQPQYLDIDYVINPKRATGLFIEKLVQIPEAAEVHEYLGGKLKLIGLKVDKRNPFLGKPLKDLKRSTIGFDYLVTAILRKNNIIIPTGNNCMRDGDTVYTLIEQSNLPKLFTAFNCPQSELKKAIILGGGITAETLAKRLSKTGVDVKIIEKNRLKCELMANRLDSNVMILNGDGTDRDLLLEEGIAKTDFFIAVTKDDETNILSCLLASKLGATKVIPLVTKVAYLPLVEKVGIDVAVRPRQIIINHILKYLRRGKVLSVASLGDERAETMEVEISPSSPLINKPLKNIKVPKDALIGAILRDGKAIIPKGEDFFAPNDKAIIFALDSAINSVQQTLTSKLGD